MSADIPTVAFRDLPADEKELLPARKWEALADDFGKAALVAARNGGRRIVFAPDVPPAVLAHLASSPHERGGLLLGDVCTLDAPSPYPYLTVVTEAVPGGTRSSGPRWLAMHSGIWSAAAPSLDVGTRVVGWYHSHPDLGVFFSDIDRRTQREFFPRSYAIGLVVDWVRRQSGVFVGPSAAVFDEGGGRRWDPIFGQPVADDAEESAENGRGDVGP